MRVNKSKHKKQHQSSGLIPVVSVLALSATAIAATPLFVSANSSVSGQVEFSADVEPAIAMTIVGNNDDGSKHSDPGISYNSVDNFSPAEVAGSVVDSHPIPATAVTGVSSSFANILPSTIVNGSAENGFRSTITVYTNDAGGYVLSVKDLDNNTNLTHTNGTDYIPTTDSALSAGTAGWNYDVIRLGTRTGDIWVPTAEGQDSITIENNAMTTTDVTVDMLPTNTSNGRITYVDYNVAAADDQATGNYQDTFIYTATADSATSNFMTISPSTIDTGFAANITATTSLYATEGQANTTFYLLTEEQYNEVKSGTPASEVGGTTLSATRTSSTPVTYNVTVPAQQGEGTFRIYADIAGYASNDYATKINIEEPTYNLTINKGTGIDSVSSTGSRKYGSTITLSATPSTGYHHTGWTVDSGGVVVTDNQFVMPRNDVVVTANASLNSCPVNYDSNAPTGTTATGSTASSTMQYGSDAALTNNGYTVTGYAFQGWAETADGNVVFPEGGPISGTTYCTTNNTPKTLYAKWAKMYNYTLQFNANAGSDTVTNLPALQNSPQQTATSHTFNLASARPVRSGYDFVEYNTDPNGSGTSYPLDTSDNLTVTLASSTAGSTPTSDGFPVGEELYAIWEETLPTSCATATPVEPGQAAGAQNMYTSGGITYVKLYTSSDKSTSACYTKDNQGTATWANASSLCPTGTKLPSANKSNGDFDQLVSAYTGSQLRTATGWSGIHWSSTSYNTNNAYFFSVGSSSVSVSYSNKTVSYNVVCMKEPPKTIATAEYMQEVEVCPDTLVEGQEYSLKDRGEPDKSYNTTRLKDGKCWMTSDYNLSSAAGTLSSDNYNVESGSTFALPSSSTSWNNNNTKNQVYNSSDTNGGLYSWYAATAGTNPSSGDSTYDICPKGWRLPTQAEYQTIINNYGSTGDELVASNAKLQYGGYCEGGMCPFVVGRRGMYWSSTTVASWSVYNLYIGSSDAHMNTSTKYYGYSVRCVFGS